MNVDSCGVCGGDLGRRGLVVDGRLRGELIWAYPCASCFPAQGEGLGPGDAQLYARQPDGRWRMVAGWRRV